MNEPQVFTDNQFPADPVAQLRGLLDSEVILIGGGDIVGVLN